MTDRLLGEERFDQGTRPEHPVRRPRPRQARSYRVDPHALSPELVGRDLHELVAGRLRRTVGREERRRHHGRRRRHRDDRAPALLHHRLPRILEQQEDRPHVRVDRRAEIVVVVGEDGRKIAAARHADRDVDPGRPSRRRDRVPDLHPDEPVDDPRRDPVLRLGQCEVELLRGGFEAIASAGTHQDVGPVNGEGLGRGEPDAAARADHDRALAGEAAGAADAVAGRRGMLVGHGGDLGAPAVGAGLGEEKSARGTLATEALCEIGGDRNRANGWLNRDAWSSDPRSDRA